MIMARSSSAYTIDIISNTYSYQIFPHSATCAGTSEVPFQGKNPSGAFFQKYLVFSFFGSKRGCFPRFTERSEERAALEHIVKEIQEVLKTNKFKKRHKRRILKLCDKLSAKSVCGGIVLSLLFTFCKVGTKGKVIKIGQYFGQSEKLLSILQLGLQANVPSFCLLLRAVEAGLAMDNDPCSMLVYVSHICDHKYSGHLDLECRHNCANVDDFLLIFSG